MDRSTGYRQQAPMAAINSCTGCDVRELSVCGVLRERELEAFAAITHNKRLQSGETIVSEGDPAYHFYNLVSGTVRLVKLLPDGRRQILGFLYPGDFIGLGTNETYTYTAEVLSDSLLCKFETKSFNAFMQTCPELHSELLDRANKKLMIVVEQLLLLGRKTPTERLATFLLSLPSDSDDIIQLAMTRQDIADFLGLTIETVSRTFSRFKADGLIALPSRATVTILDRAQLEDVAEES